MKQPLVTRPPYGEGPRATAQLPGGGPADKGLVLDKDDTGYSTFNKPEDDIREPNNDDESIHRIDGPDDWTKDPSHIDLTDQGDASPAYMGLGDKDPNDYSKTKYPYRDDKPNTHNAGDPDSEFVAQLYILAKKAEILFPFKERTAARVAATAEQILGGLNPKFRERAKKVSVTLKRADLKHLRWIFRVRGNGVYAVKMKAMRPRKNRTKLSKMDLELSCSCPAWQWQGPEFHGTQEQYQLGKPVGTATSPDIRDPQKHNRVCKHVAAVLEATRDWDIPAPKKKTK